MARKHPLDPELAPQAREVVARLRASGGSVKLVANKAGEFTKARLVPPDIYHAMPAADKAFFRHHKQEFIAAAVEVSAIATGGDSEWDLLRSRHSQGDASASHRECTEPAPPAPTPPPQSQGDASASHRECPTLPPVGPDGRCAVSVEQYHDWCAWQAQERRRLRAEAPPPEPTVAVKFRNRMDGPIEFIPTRLFNPETHVEWDFKTRRPI